MKYTVLYLICLIPVYVEQEEIFTHSWIPKKCQFKNLKLQIEEPEIDEEAQDIQRQIQEVMESPILLEVPLPEFESEPSQSTIPDVCIPDLLHTLSYLIST